MYYLKILQLEIAMETIAYVTKASKNVRRLFHEGEALLASLTLKMSAS